MAKNSLRKRSLLAGYRPSCAVFGALALILLTARSDAAETKASCVFCEIVAGTRDATRVVYRDDGQSVFHLHFHVIPRFKGEPPAGGEKAIAPAAEVEAVAARIRAALATELSGKRNPEAVSP